jgi:LysM repeat protein
MTISRSRGAHLAAVALALGLPAVPLASQQPQPQSAPAAQQPAAAPQTLGAPPATHTVQQGETLWGLAKQFLGDPLLWPEIYRLNTNVIEDPHYIFPGEELRFVPPLPETAAGPAPAPAQAAQPAAPPAPGEITVAPTPTDTTAPRPQPAPSGNPFEAPTIFTAKNAVAVSASTLRLQSEQAYRPVRVGEHFSAGFLTEGERLNPGRLLGNTRTASISRLTVTTSATLFSEVAVAPPPGDTLKPADLLLAYQVPRRIDPYGEVILPTGLLKITAVGSPTDNATAQVIAVYQAIASGQYVIRVPGFAPGNERPVPVDSGGVVGSVIDMRDPHELVAFQDALFLDRGQQDSVHLGDIFQISGTTTAASGIGHVVQNQVKVLIVYVRPHTSTGVVIQIDRPDVQPGSRARQVRRMPS